MILHSRPTKSLYFITFETRNVFKKDKRRQIKKGKEITQG